MDKRSELPLPRFHPPPTHSPPLHLPTPNSSYPFPPAPTSLSSKQLFCIEQQQSQNASIEDGINSISNPYSPYKCYKCFGVKTQSSLGYSLPLCEQCQGYEFISHNNPIALLLQSVLNKKLPWLTSRQENEEKEEKENEQKEDEQKEQQESAARQQLVCTNCSKEQAAQQCYSCQECQDYSLCGCCFQNSLFIHLKGHRFARATAEHSSNQYQMKLGESLLTMKKISEQESESAGKQQQQQQQPIRCDFCQETIQEFFLYCPNCQQQGRQFTVCSHCYSAPQFTHTQGHSMELQSVKGESKLSELFCKPSTSSSTCTNIKENNQEQENAYSPQIKRDLTKSSGRSMVFFPHLDLDSSHEMPTDDDVATSHTEILWSPSHTNYLQPHKLQPHEMQQQQEDTFNPESPITIRLLHNFAHQKEPQTLFFRSASMVSIKMQDYEDSTHHFLQHHYANSKEETSFLTPYALSSHSRGQAEVVARVIQKKEDEEFIFRDYQCDMCLAQPIKNARYHCKQCQNYDLCHTCYLSLSQNHQHQNFEQIDGRVIKRDRQLKFLRVRESSVRQSYFAVRKWP